MELQKNLPKLTLGVVQKTVLSLFIILVSFGIGYLLGVGEPKIKKADRPKVEIDRSLPEGKTVDFSLFWRVWDTLELRYLDKEKLIPEDMIYGAIQGMVAAIKDPYTAFLPPEENKVVQEDLRGNFGGIGINIGYVGTQLAVIAPLPKTPAEKAGIKAGDFIIGIKDEEKGIDVSTSGMSLPQAVQIIRGEEGTKITLSLLRKGEEEPIVVDVVRGKIDVPSVELTYLGEDKTIAHLKLTKFGGETKEEWESAVSELLKNPDLKGIVLDLKNNTGGYLQSAVEIASDFVKTGSVVAIQENSDGTKENYKTEGIPRLLRYKVVVVVNKGSASASEILAGALRDLKKIKIVGETTFGKGTIQEPIQLEDGSGLHITTARWLTPLGYWVNDKGLEPDIKIEDNSETIEDEQFLEAVRILKS